MRKPAILGGKPVRKTFLPFAKPFIGEEEKKAVMEVLESGWISLGPKNREFEEKLANYLKVRHVIVVNSCTAGLFLSLKLLEVKPGDEVIIPTYTFCASANVVEHLGAKPVFVDVEPNTMLIDTEKIEEAITDKTKAIMPVHFAGQPADLDKILRIAKEYQIDVVEDAAHAIGAEFDGKKIGNFGLTTSFSFYAIKNMTTGDGGAIATNNDEVAERLRILRLHGMDKDAWKRYSAKGSWFYDVLDAGYKMNLTDIQAALGIVQLSRLETFIKRRRKLAKYYIELLGELDFIELPIEKPKRKHVFHLFTIFLKEDKLRINRDKFIEALRAENIGTSVHFIPVHTFTYYRIKYGYKPGDFPVAWEYYNREISLPLFNGMKECEVEDVAKAMEKIGEWYKR